MTNAFGMPGLGPTLIDVLVRTGLYSSRGRHHFRFQPKTLMTCRYPRKHLCQRLRVTTEAVSTVKTPWKALGTPPA